MNNTRCMQIYNYTRVYAKSHYGILNTNGINECTYYTKHSHMYSYKNNMCEGHAFYATFLYYAHIQKCAIVLIG